MKKNNIINFGLILGVILLAINTTSCKDDDDNDKTHEVLTSFKYDPLQKVIKKGEALTGTKAVTTPSNTNVKYSIKGIKKDGKAFTNPANGVKVNENDGTLSLAKENTLETGTYIVTIEGDDQFKKNNKKTTTYTIGVSAGEITEIKYETNTLTVKKGVEKSSDAVKITPLGALVNFTIKEIKKDNNAFTNPTKGIKISEVDGKLSLENGHTLDKGEYVVTVEGEDLYKENNKKTVTFTITITE